MQDEEYGDRQLCPCINKAILVRHLQRRKLDAALFQIRAKRFIAINALSRSLQLRHQLIQAQHVSRAANDAASSGHGSESYPSTSLDPSVKALIEKLTEIAELLPAGLNREQSSTSVRQARGVSDNSEQQTGQRSAQSPSGYPHDAAKDSMSPNDHPKGIGQSRIHSDNGGWAGDDGDRKTVEDLAVSAVSGEFVTGDTEAESQSTIQDMLLDDEVDPDNPTVGQQLLELDTNIESLFNDLQENSVQRTSVHETEAKAAPRENDPGQVETEKQRVDRARKRERAALLAQLGRKNMATFRRPRWRWMVDGVPNPDPDLVLKGKSYWRAAVLIVVVFYVRPQRNVLKRKARSKERDTKDWNATLTIYFNRCQTWLLKTSRVPIANSILKSPKLTFRLGRLDGKSDVYGAPTQGVKGFAGAKPKKKRSFVCSLLGAVHRGATQENLSITLMRLKVHTKGVLRGITHEMPPSDILTFFSYLTADGNYFPKGFFFEEEAKRLSFDGLGAVRKLAVDVEPPDNLDHTLYALHHSNILQVELEADAKCQQEGFFEGRHLKWLVSDLSKDGQGDKTGAAGAVARPTDLRAAVLHGSETLPGKLQPMYRHDASGRWFDTNLVEMVLTNYLMVRVLIPWILLYPQESGLVPSSGVKPSLLTHNCQVLASVVYLVMRVLRPELTPPNADTKQAAALEESECARKKFEEYEKAARGENEEGKQGGSENDVSDSDDEGSEEETSRRSTIGEKKNKKPVPKGNSVGRNTPGKVDGAMVPTKSDESGVRDGRADKRTKKRLRRRRASARVRTQPHPRTVQQIMQHKRYVSLSDKQLVQELLPDAYFMPVAEQLRPWVLELAAEFDVWMQNVVVIVMNRVENGVNAIRQERAQKEHIDDQDA